MSTLTPPSGRVASEDATDPLEDHHLALPTFHSIRENSSDRDARTDSTASGSRSRQSRSRNDDSDRSRLLERLSFASGGRGEHDATSREREREKEKEKEKEKENDAPRYNTARNSGGFLMDPVSDIQRPSRVSLTPSRKGSKRERPSDDSSLVVPKRKQRNNRPSDSSFRSSPLASEIRQDPVAHHHSKSDALVPGTDIRRSLSSSHTDSGLNGSSASTSRKPEEQSSPKFGYDNDPAQIVNMALSLSEGRRRLASGRRYVSTEHGDRRVISGASTLGPRNSVHRKSIAPFLATQRHLSQNGSPKPRFSTVYHDPSSSPARPVSAASHVDIDEDIDVDETLGQHISAATAARVEKAKIYFELAHEHRRLLPHLPPLRKPGAVPQIPPPEAFQKAYNPLQYVRNRKLRIWEKTPIDTEADGWHDVQKVRTWVDAVVSSHTEIQHDNMECVRLPPLDQKAVKDDSEDPDDSPDEPKTTTSPRLPDHLHHAKPSRPRSDWVTHPADLIADAYWLEQGLNKSKIQDRDNNLIYPANTTFKFSGWRNTGPVEIPSILQQPSPPTEPNQHSPEEPPPSALPELPSFKSAHHKHKSGRHGRRRDIIKESLQGKDTSSSRERSRIRRKLFQDSSDSEYSGSTSSDAAGTERGRKRLRRKMLEPSNNDNLERNGSNSLPKHSPHAFGLGHGDSSQGSSAPASKRSSADPSSLNKLFSVDSIKKASPLNRSRNRQDFSRPHSLKIATRSSLEHERQPRPSTEYDTATSANSPNGVEWPSIAINLSPPPSRPVSPTKKPISTILHPFHRKPHKDHGQISTADFAPPPIVHSNQQHQHGSDEDKHGESPGTRGTSPMTRGVSPLSKHHTNSTQPEDMIAPQSSNEHRYSTASKVSSRSTNDHSKIRGIFKGGRIAEIVGNEVSRVGDFIWKRDLPAVYKHRTASEGSLRSYDGTDSEKETHLNGALLKSSSQTNPRSRSSTVSSTKSDRQTPAIVKVSPPPNDRHRYNNPNLPSFTSPFQKDRERQEKKQALLNADDADHISRLAAQHRSASHSPRLDRIALPKLDTGGPPTPNGMTRQKSYGFGAALNLTRSQDASEMLNNAIGSVTGLHALRPSRSTGDLSRAGSDQDQDGEPGGVSWRDIDRAFALLYSSTVKAREIGRRAEDSDATLPKFLLDSLTPENQALHSATPLRVRKREYHIVAAQNIMKTLENQASTFGDKLHSFSASVAPSLHTQLQRLEDEVENTMTPQVRGTADQAGELSMKLSTASTLAVKELNDTIDAAFRRRRRGPVRLFRKIWFAGIEWTVVGVLWLIWAVVSTIRLALGTVRCVGCVVSWLLWIG